MKNAAWAREDQAAHPEKYLWGRAQQRAAAKGIAFSITPDDIVIPERCPILGSRLVVHRKVFRDYTVGGEDDSMSLDRIVPSLGYVPGNVAVISWRANRLKGAASLAELESLVAWLRSLPNPQDQ